MDLNRLTLATDIAADALEAAEDAVTLLRAELEAAEAAVLVADARYAAADAARGKAYVAAAARYVVEACDNCGSVEGLVRDRTWLLVEVTAEERTYVGEYLTRVEAYTAKRERELEVAS